MLRAESVSSSRFQSRGREPRMGRHQCLRQDRQHGSHGGFAISRCREKDRAALAAFHLQVVNYDLLAVTAATSVLTEAQTRICS